MYEHMTVSERREAPPLAPPPTPSTSVQSFSQALDIYRTNYIQYKTTGREEFKMAYENAEAWVVNYLKSMETQVSQGSKNITDFVNKYSNSETEFGKIAATMRQVKTQGPAVQDKYMTIKRVQSETTGDEEADLYVKASIVAALVGIAALVSFV